MTRKSPAARFALLAAITMLVLSLVPIAMAAKRGHSWRLSDPTLSASPNPVQTGAQYSVSGCGYAPGEQVNVLINQWTFLATGAGADGCVSFTWWAGSPGTYTIEAYQSLTGGKQTLLGSTTLNVVP